MELRINSWGNSLGLRLPKALAEMLGVTNGSSVHAQMINGQLVISADPLDRLRTLASTHSLDALLAQAPKDYDPTADEELREWRDDPPVGREIIDDDWS